MGSRLSPVMQQTKAESITVRLDPKIRYGLELLARKQRRNLSSVVEWALQKAIHDPVDGLYDEKSDKLNFLNFLWDVEESDRLYQLATCRPELLTFEEEKLVKVITESDYFIYLDDLHKHLKDPTAPQGTVAYHQKMRGSLREYFETFKKISSGELTKDSLPKPPKAWLSKHNNK
ncbi:MAG: hypothetical protein PQ612_00060 [Rickettsiales bacterium]|nr:hypothetical protein [Pseudomonadota bacterium]MDA0965690.1 hypothetical protein [Pseudomonadota bacterium]MDG4543014.1 hypothetical protein [Rickettsiales bacterium]MDG4544538.1 hypothetical protein [Rickettsiales bacterium]MDG4546660.1 hypothetical protein [Rickettsiales bacterium]